MSDTRCTPQRAAVEYMIDAAGPSVDLTAGLIFPFVQRHAAPATRKQVMNALDHMRRTGKLSRVARGIYRKAAP